MSGHKVIDVYPYRVKNENISFLVMHRTKNRIYADQWRMVAGKITNNETAWQAGLRELFEETGCRPEFFWSVPSVNHFYDHKTDQILLIPVFAARLSESCEIIMNDEHDDYDWIDIDAVQEKIFWPEQKKMIQYIYESVRFNTVLPDWIIK